jgi:hypothetical protein
MAKIKKTPGKKPPKDINQLAAYIVEESTKETRPINPNTYPPNKPHSTPK